MAGLVVDTSWVVSDGNNSALGDADKWASYPSIDFKWVTSHEVLTSPLFDFPIRGNVITFMINTEAVDTATDATITFKLLGAAKPQGTFAEIYTPSAIANAAFDAKTPTLRYDLDSVANKVYPYMKISLDPDANLSHTIRVGILTGAKI